MSYYFTLDTGWSGWAGFGISRRLAQSGQQIKFFQNGLANQYLITQHQRFFQGIAPITSKMIGSVMATDSVRPSAYSAIRLPRDNTPSACMT